MSYKLISVPSPIPLIDLVTNERLQDFEQVPVGGGMARMVAKGEMPPVTFKKFIINTVLADPKWTQGAEWMDACAEIIEAVRSTEDAGEVKLHVTSHRKLVEIMKGPTNGFQGWHPTVLAQLRPFVNCVIDAKDHSGASA